MCKVFVINDMSKIDKKSLTEVINVIASKITVTETHGFGYAIQGDKGLFGERTTEPKDFKSSFKGDILTHKFLEIEYDRLGSNKSQPIGSGIFHGRTSTNDINITNTHPLRKKGWTLIHNGVVSNKGDKYEMDTTNDTEHLLHYMTTTGMKGIEEHVSGYYAFAAFDPKGQLHIARDSNATLYCAYSSTIDSLIFATTESLLSGICKKLKWARTRISKVIDDVYLVFSVDGEITQSEISPRGYGTYESNYMSDSLGYLDETGYGGRTFSEIREKHIADAKNTLNDEVEGIDKALVKPLEEESEYKFAPHGEIEDKNGNIRDLITNLSELIEVYSMDRAGVELYVQELDDMDSSYTIKDYRDRPVDIIEFISLSLEEQIMLTVIRPDGTLMCAYEYSTDTLPGYNFESVA